MVMDSAVAMLGQARRRPWIAYGIVAVTTAFSCAGPQIFPDAFGRAPFLYLLPEVAVLTASILTGFRTTLVVGALVFLDAYVVDRAGGASSWVLAARTWMFGILAMVVNMAASAVRVYQGRLILALNELKTSEATLQAILDNGPDAILVVDPTGLVVRFSPAGEKLFGWPAHEIVGRHVRVLAPAPYDYGFRATLGQNREIVGQRRDGSQFPMSVRVGEVRVGEQLLYTGFVHDLTDLQAANDRNQQLRAQLAHVWSMNSLGEMAGVLAHELNQPLAAVSNYVRGARTMAARLELSEDDLIEALDKAGDQAIRAGEIIRRMRGMVSRQVADPKPESLAALIREVDFMTGLAARESGAWVRYFLSQEPDEVLVDRVQIQQVITNLVRNAVEAMRDSEKRILTIITQREAEGWVVRVEDSGPGVAPKVLDHLFQPMESTKAQGMGVGLSISRGIIEAHSGSIWVESSPLGGAAFCFRLPGKTEAAQRLD